jgi:hypothetical protein
MQCLEGEACSSACDQHPEQLHNTIVFACRQDGQVLEPVIALSRQRGTAAMRQDAPMRPALPLPPAVRDSCCKIFCATVHEEGLPRDAGRVVLDLLAGAGGGAAAGGGFGVHNRGDGAPKACRIWLRIPSLSGLESSICVSTPQALSSKLVTGWPFIGH